MIRARVRSGMANAKAKGAKIGRPQATQESIPQIFFRHYPAYKNGSLNVSELARACDRRLKHPSEAVKVGDVVVLDVDEKRHRISLSMKQAKRTKNA